MDNAQRFIISPTPSAIIRAAQRPTPIRRPLELSKHGGDHSNIERDINRHLPNIISGSTAIEPALVEKKLNSYSSFSPLNAGYEKAIAKANGEGIVMNEWSLLILETLLSSECIIPIAIEGIPMNKTLDSKFNMGNGTGHSSEVIERIDSQKVRTSSGAVYILSGPINAERCIARGFDRKVVETFKNGFPIDWVDVLTQSSQKLRDFHKRKQLDPAELVIEKRVEGMLKAAAKGNALQNNSTEGKEKDDASAAEESDVDFEVEKFFNSSFGSNDSGEPVHEEEGEGKGKAEEATERTKAKPVEAAQPSDLASVELTTTTQQSTDASKSIDDEIEAAITRAIEEVTNQKSDEAVDRMTDLLLDEMVDRAVEDVELPRPTQISPRPKDGKSTTNKKTEKTPPATPEKAPRTPERASKPPESKAQSEPSTAPAPSTEPSNTPAKTDKIDQPATETVTKPSDSTKAEDLSKAEVQTTGNESEDTEEEVEVETNKRKPNGRVRTVENQDGSSGDELSKNTDTDSAADGDLDTGDEKNKATRRTKDQSKSPPKTPAKPSSKTPPKSTGKTTSKTAKSPPTETPTTKRNRSPPKANVENANGETTKANVTDKEPVSTKDSKKQTESEGPKTPARASTRQRHQPDTYAPGDYVSSSRSLKSPIPAPVATVRTPSPGKSRRTPYPETPNQTSPEHAPNPTPTLKTTPKDTKSSKKKTTPTPSPLPSPQSFDIPENFDHSIPMLTDSPSVERSPSPPKTTKPKSSSKKSKKATKSVAEKASSTTVPTPSNAAPTVPAVSPAPSINSTIEPVSTEKAPISTTTRATEIPTTTNTPSGNNPPVDASTPSPQSTTTITVNATQSKTPPSAASSLPSTPSSTLSNKNPSYPSTPSFFDKPADTTKKTSSVQAIPLTLPKTTTTTTPLSKTLFELMPPPSVPPSRRRPQKDYLISPKPVEQLVIVGGNEDNNNTPARTPVRGASPSPPPISSVSTTRSGRTSMPPLNWWQNQTKVTPFHKSFTVIRMGTEAFRQNVFSQLTETKSKEDVNTDEKDSSDEEPAPKRSKVSSTEKKKKKKKSEKKPKEHKVDSEKQTPEPEKKQPEPVPEPEPEPELEPESEKKKPEPEKQQKESETRENDGDNDRGEPEPVYDVPESMEDDTPASERTEEEKVAEIVANLSETEKSGKQRKKKDRLQEDKEVEEVSPKDDDNPRHGKSKGKAAKGETPTSKLNKIWKKRGSDSEWDGSSSENQEEKEETEKKSHSVSNRQKQQQDSQDDDDDFQPRKRRKVETQKKEKGKKVAQDAPRKRVGQSRKAKPSSPIFDYETERPPVYMVGGKPRVTPISMSDAIVHTVAADKRPAKAQEIEEIDKEVADERKGSKKSNKRKEDDREKVEEISKETKTKDKDHDKDKPNNHVDSDKAKLTADTNQTAEPVKRKVGRPRKDPTKTTKDKYTKRNTTNNDVDKDSGERPKKDKTTKNKDDTTTAANHVDEPVVRKRTGRSKKDATNDLGNDKNKEKGNEKDKDKEKEKTKEKKTKTTDKPKEKGKTKTKDTDDKPNGKPKPTTAKSKTSSKHKNKEDEDGWTEEELKKLSGAHQMVPTQGIQFWENVSRSFPGRTATECSEKFNSLFPTPQKNKTSKNKEKEYSPITLDDKGTLKLKRKLRNISKQESKRHVDDAFGATPLRGKQKHFEIELSGDEKEVDDIFKGQQSSEEHDNHEQNSQNDSDSLLKPLNRDVLDRYMRHSQFIISGPNRKKSSKTKKHSAPTTTTTTTTTKRHTTDEDAATIASLRDADDLNTSMQSTESAEDYYFSDASDEI